MVLLLLSSLLLLLVETVSREDNEKFYNISVIIKEGNGESFARIRQGMEQAALDTNANVSFITLAEDNDVDGQIKLLEREMRNGADAIVISPIDYYEMSKAIENTIKRIPVVLIGSEVNSEQLIPYISSNNYQLGVALAEELIQRGNSRKEILIVKSKWESSDIKDRQRGFVETIEETKNTYSYFEALGDELTISDEIKNKIKKDDIDIIVAFDTDILGIVGKIKKEFIKNNDENISIEVFGSGITSKIISYLEEDIINAIGIENEFNVGYLAIKGAVDEINGKRVPDSKINWTIINNRNMYLDENQRLLFPFVR